MTNEYSLLLDGVTFSTYNPDHNTNLAKFRHAIGINSSCAFERTVLDSPPDLESARQSAKGLYKQVISDQRYRNRQHRAFEALFYSALAAQIIIGAVLTSLGPVSDSHSRAITILGIFNTSIAGLLTVLKGQGLPERFRKDEYQMKKVQDFIEEMDVRLSVGGADEFTAVELDEVVQEVWERYNAAVDGAERNKLSVYARSQKERRTVHTQAAVDGGVTTKP